VSTKEITDVFTALALALLWFIAVAVLGLVYWAFGIYATAWLVTYATAVLVIFGITEFVLGIRRLFKMLASSGLLDKPISAIPLAPEQGSEAQDLAQLVAAIAGELDEDTERRPNWRAKVSRNLSFALHRR
jgi:hypothetical protein